MYKFLQYEFFDFDVSLSAVNQKRFSEFRLYLLFKNTGGIIRIERVGAKREFHAALPRTSIFVIKSSTPTYDIILYLKIKGNRFIPLFSVFRGSAAPKKESRDKPETLCRFSAYYSTIALIRLMPALELCSLVMRKRPSSAVFSTCGPPQTSTEYPSIE